MEIGLLCFMAGSPQLRISVHAPTLSRCGRGLGDGGHILNCELCIMHCSTTRQILHIQMPEYLWILTPGLRQRNGLAENQEGEAADTPLKERTIRVQPSSSLASSREVSHQSLLSPCDAAVLLIRIADGDHRIGPLIIRNADPPDDAPIPSHASMANPIKHVPNPRT